LTTALFGKWHLLSDPTGFNRWTILPDQGDDDNPAFPGLGIRGLICCDSSGIGLRPEAGDVHQRPVRFESRFALSADHPTGSEDHFTVVWWEQRGAGISYTGDIDPKTLNSRQLIEDTKSLSRYLRERFGKEYSFSDKIKLWKAKAKAGLSVISDEILATDLSRKITRLEVPFYIFHGAMDYTVSYPRG
jgi:hypothetical protein